MWKRLKLWWAVRSVVTAIALDPDRFYVMIWDPKWMTEDVIVQLHRMLAESHINGVFVAMEHDGALRSMPVLRADLERLLEAIPK
jgi:hypothetical protein